MAAQRVKHSSSGQLTRSKDFLMFKLAYIYVIITKMHQIRSEVPHGTLKSSNVV